MAAWSNMPGGIHSLASGTNTSSRSRFRESVPRIPRGSQSPWMVTPSASAGTPMKRTRGSPSTMQTMLWIRAAPDSEAKILRPFTR